MPAAHHCFARIWGHTAGDGSDDGEFIRLEAVTHLTSLYYTVLYPSSVEASTMLFVILVLQELVGLATGMVYPSPESSTVLCQRSTMPPTIDNPALDEHKCWI